MGKANYIIGVLVMFLGFSTIASAEMLLFVGEGCPHCEDIEQYLEDNGLYEKFNIQKYEIFKNLDNRQLYLQKTAELGFESDSVPLLINNKEHIQGSNAIKKYFENNDEISQNISISVLNTEDIKDLNKMIKEEQNNSEKNKTLAIIIGLIIGIAFIGIILLLRKKK